MSFLKRLSIPEQRDLWLARMYYFSYMGGMGFLAPFLNLFYTSQVGLNGKQIGTLASTGAVIGLI